MYWSPADIADAVNAQLQVRAKEDDQEQAAYGFDSLSELKLHPLIQKALMSAGYGVWREQRYPGDQKKTLKSHGKRCDLVLSRDFLPLRDWEAENTLFAATDAMGLDEAYRLEIKTVAQFIPGGTATRYSAELLSPVVEDVRKLWSDPVIRYGGLLLVLFTESQEIAEHDVIAWQRKCMDRGVPVSPPALRGFRINDRIGNGWCATAVFGIRGF